MILAKPFVKQTWAKGISPEGRPILVPGNMPTEEGTKTCPDVGGGTNFYSPSYDPANRLFIVTARETCTTYHSFNEPFKLGERYAGGGAVKPRDQVNYGALRAIDPDDRRSQVGVPLPERLGLRRAVDRVGSRLRRRRRRQRHGIRVENRQESLVSTSSASASAQPAERPIWWTASSTILCLPGPR